MNTQTDQQKEFQTHINEIADNLTNGIELTADDEFILEEYDLEVGDMMPAFNYLQDALDIQYIVGSDKQYLGARVLVAFGGPNIWINTHTGTVEGYWWSMNAFANFTDGMGLDDELEELYNC